MRKITREACEAFEAGRKFTGGNTFTNGTELYLFGNMIARKVDGKVQITDCGWVSATTQERLNGLTGVKLSRKLGEWILNGKKWSGEWITV